MSIFGQISIVSNIHLRTPTGGEKAYKCHQCPYGASQSSNFKNHPRTQKKNQKCPYTAESAYIVLNRLTAIVELKIVPFAPIFSLFYSCYNRPLF